MFLLEADCKAGREMGKSRGRHSCWSSEPPKHSRGFTEGQKPALLSTEALWRLGISWDEHTKTNVSFLCIQASLHDLYLVLYCETPLDLFWMELNEELPLCYSVMLTVIAIKQIIYFKTMTMNHLLEWWYNSKLSGIHKWRLSRHALRSS